MLSAGLALFCEKSYSGGTAQVPTECWCVREAEQTDGEADVQCCIKVERLILHKCLK